MTIKELSENAQVGISTVMRTVKALGYTNFNELRKDLYDESIPTVSKWALKKSIMELEDENGKKPTLVKVWEESVNLLNRTLDSDLMASFDKAVDLIVHSRYTHVFGTRPYKAMALYFELLLGEFFPNIRQLGYDTDVFYDRILQLDADEVVVFFSLEPYTTRIIDAAKLIHSQGNQIILITDHLSCPVVPYATVILKVEVSEEQFSVVPIVALLEALSIEIGKRTAGESVEKLKRLEKILQKKKITYSY